MSPVRTSVIGTQHHAATLTPGRTRWGSTFVEEWTWQLQGSCRGLPSSVFYFPENERGHRRRRRELRAKRICLECPVIRECLRHALTWPETWGIWGATNPTERAEILDRRTTPARGALLPSHP
jgi:WhiB family transcriptional regulator, redox-sensing transcriptional regulator